MRSRPTVMALVVLFALRRLRAAIRRQEDAFEYESWDCTPEGSALRPEEAEASRRRRYPEWEESSTGS